MTGSNDCPRLMPRTSCLNGPRPAMKQGHPRCVEANSGKELPVPRNWRPCADVRIETAVLGAESYAAVGIIVRSECQTIRTTLLVVDISEFAGVAKSDSGGRCGSRTCIRTRRSRHCVRRTQVRACGNCRSRRCRARHATTAIIDRAIDRMRASSEPGCAQNGASHDQRRSHHPSITLNRGPLNGEVTPADAR